VASKETNNEILHNTYNGSQKGSL